MVERREAELLEPALGKAPSLHAVDGPSADDLPSLCADLHRARMVAGYELQDVATALRIRLTYLEALEEGRFDDLPGMTYAVGFLRSYSQYLGLDPDEMIARLKRETAAGGAQRDLSFPVPPKEGGKPKVWLILGVLVLAGLVYGGWYVYSTEGQIATNLVTDVSTTLTEVAGLADDEKVMESLASETVEPTESQTESPAEAPPDNASTNKTPSDIEGGTQTANADSPTATTSLAPNSLWKESEEGSAEAVETVAQASTEAAVVTKTNSETLIQSASETATQQVTTTQATATQATAAVSTAGADNADAAAASFETAPVKTAPVDTVPVEVAPPRSDSLWDNAANNQAGDAPVESNQASSGSSDSLAIVSNATAQDLNGATGADETSGSGEFKLALNALEASDASTYVPSIYGAENMDFRIAITAKADSWVQIQGPNNELLLTRILRTGDIYQVPDRTGLIMVTGNAGALELRVDGAVVTALGPVGVVRRNVPLDPETLITGIDASR
jgi:cytoskeleton protein RodZ